MRRVVSYEISRIACVFCYDDVHVGLCVTLEYWPPWGQHHLEMLRQVKKVRAIDFCPFLKGLIDYFSSQINYLYLLL